MRYLSLFGGIGGCTAAVERLGLPWRAVSYAETDQSACSVLSARWPGVRNLGDVRGVDWRSFRGAVDIVLGGPPCQDFSVAGRQAGASGASGALLGEYLRAVEEVRPAWIVMENVPGLLGTGRGRDFGHALGRLAELGYSAGWRVLDARHFGVPQRRRRLWLVGHYRDSDGPGRVLGIAEGCGGHPAEGGPEGEEGAPSAAGSPLDGLTGWRRPAIRVGPVAVPGALAVNFRHVALSRVAPTLTTGGVGISFNVVPGVLHADTHNLRVGGIAQTLRADRDGSASDQGCALLHDGRRWTARRLTPTECLRLQGYDDGWLDGARLRGRPLTDAARYRLAGNAWTVPVAAWVLERLSAVEAGGLGTTVTKVS